MKKLTLFLLVLLTTVLPLHRCLADDLTYGDYTYRLLSENEAEITGYLGTETELELPDEIEGIPVTSIGEGAFTRMDDLESIIIPEGVLSLSDFVFAESTSIRSISLPEGLLYMGKLVFQGCINLEQITLPASLVRVGWNPFDRCDKLESVAISEANPFFHTEEGVLYDSKNNSLVTYPAGRQAKEFVIPENIEEIGFAAFSENKWLHEVSLHENLTVINGNPFCGCTGLQNIKVSFLNSKFEVRAGSLYNKQDRELIAYLWSAENSTYTVPNGTVSIAGEAFYRHTELTEVKLPKTVVSIGDAAFAQSGVTSVSLPDSVVSMGNSTFSGCSDLKTVSLPSGLTWIGYSAFYECPALEEITLPKTLTSIGEAAFMSCSGLKKIVIPENVYFIDDFAFAFCSSLEYVDFPENIFSIGRGAFYGADDLIAEVFPDSLAEEWAEATGVRYNLKNITYMMTDQI